ncbi:hypothetical protein [Agromyces sp. ZXT2-3]|uniref:hypothetical protein n=1 Tax=Agromyces sp. ZXT2-3 TaxID=3461152 RepID=UPI004054AD34
MSPARLLTARSRARLGVLAGSAAVSLLLTAFLATVLGILVAAPGAGARTGIAAADGADGAVTWQTRLASDSDAAGAQADAAGRVLDRFVAAHGADVRRSVVSDPVALLGGGPVDGAEAEAGVVLLADPAAAERAELVDGAWPDEAGARAAAEQAGAVPGAIHAGATDGAGLAPGAVLELDGVRILVVGTWLPTDPRAPEWAGDPLLATGSADGALGPLLVDESAAADARAAVAVRWTATIDPATTQPADLAALQASIPLVLPALQDDAAVGTDGIVRSGGLPGTIDAVLAGLDAARALAPLPVLLLGVAGLVALLRMASLLATERRGETTLLLARGASPASITRSAAVEALAIAVPTALVGALAASVALAVLAPGDADASVSAWAVAAGVAIAVVAVHAGTAWVDARRPVVRGAGDVTGRAGRAVAAGGVVLLVVLAGVSLWQFRLYGSPIVRTATGGTSVDPLASLAPVLVLLALAVGALAVTGVVLRVFERWASGRVGLVPALPARQLARRTPVYASAILVLSFAAGGLALGAAVDGSWRAFDRAASAASLGGEARVELAGREVVDGGVPAGVDAMGELPDETVTIPVHRGEARVGSDPVGIVALPVARLAEAAPGAGSPLATDVRDALVASRGAAVEPGSTIVLDVTVSSVGATSASDDPPTDAATGAIGTDGGTAAPRAAISVWLLDADGAAHRLPAGEAGTGTALRLEATAPDLSGLTILGVEARMAGGAGGLQVDVAGAGAASDLDGTLAVSSRTPTDRLVAAARGSDADAAVPVVIDRALAGLVAADPGDPIEFRLRTGGATVRAEIADVVDVLPGVGPGILVDLGALSAAAFAADAGVPEFDELWISGPDAAGSAVALVDAAGVAADVDTRAGASAAATVAPAITALWIGAAGAAGFALVALAGLVAALATARSGELAVLRSLGATARLQASARRAELVGLVIAATAIGLGIGLAVARLTAPELGMAAVPGSAAGLEPTFTTSWFPLAAALAVLVAGCLVIAFAAARSVGARASTAVPGTEDR